MEKVVEEKSGGVFRNLWWMHGWGCEGEEWRINQKRPHRPRRNWPQESGLSLVSSHRSLNFTHPAKVIQQWCEHRREDMRGAVEAKCHQADNTHWPQQDEKGAAKGSET